MGQRPSQSVKDLGREVAAQNIRSSKSSESPKNKRSGNNIQSSNSSQQKMTGDSIQSSANPKQKTAGDKIQSSKSSEQKTIHDCALSGDIVGLRAQLEQNPSLLNSPDAAMKQTPLHLAASRNNLNNVKIVDFLINQKEINLKARNQDNETPLHTAAKNGCSETAKSLLGARASLEAKAINDYRPLHLAVSFALRVGDCLIVRTLLEHGACCFAKDKAGKTALDYVPEGSENVELKKLINHYFQEQRKQRIVRAINAEKAVMAELNTALSSIVGLHELKLQLQKWAKGMVLNDLRSTLAGSSIPPTRKPPHMVFLGNPGTGKTTVARILGKLLKKMGILTSDKVIEVQRTDLIAEYIGQTGPKTRAKIEEAKGGILFVDEAYRLVNTEHRRIDFGLEALEEIMAVMESAPLAVIFAGYVGEMKRMILSNDGLRRRISKFLLFDDFSCADLAQMTILKMAIRGKNSKFCGLKLHQSCSAEAIADLIERETTEEQRNKMNGGLVDHMLENAVDNLNFNLNLEQMNHMLENAVDNLNLDQMNENDLHVITMEDLAAGLRSFSDSHSCWENKTKNTSKQEIKHTELVGLAEYKTLPNNSY